jgi:hypothetical protein
MAYENVPRAVQDLVRLAAAKLEQRERELAHRRRSPLYWGDRIVSAVLRFPAYLVGKIVGVPTARIEGSVLGLLLRLAEVASGILTVFFGGRAAGWW